MDPKQIADAYQNAPQETQRQIAKLLKLDVTETIEDKLMNFGTITRSKSIPLHYNTPSGTDRDIVRLLPHATVSTIPAPQGKWKNVDTANGTTESEMLKTAIKMSLSQAIDTFTEILTSGVFYKFETYRFIFLEETNTDENCFKLICARLSGGELRMCLLMVCLDKKWNGTDIAWLQQQ